MHLFAGYRVRRSACWTERPFVRHALRRKVLAHPAEGARAGTGCKSASSGESVTSGTSQGDALKKILLDSATEAKRRIGRSSRRLARRRAARSRRNLISEFRCGIEITRPDAANVPAATPPSAPAEASGRRPHMCDKLPHTPGSAPCGQRGDRTHPRRCDRSARRPRRGVEWRHG